MAGRVRKRDESSKRPSQHYRLFDFEGVAETVNVVAPGFQIQSVGSTPIAAAIAAMVQVNELRDLGQHRKVGLENRMIEARAAMEQDNSGHLAHSRTVGPQPGAFDIEKEPAITNIHTHRFF